MSQNLSDTPETDTTTSTTKIPPKIASAYLAALRGSRAIWYYLAGWLPALAEGHDASVIAQAEVEL